MICEYYYIGKSASFDPHRLPPRRSTFHIEHDVVRQLETPALHDSAIQAIQLAH